MTPLFVLSWVVLGGRCRHCRRPIPLRYPVVEGATAGLFAVLALHFGPTLALALPGVLRLPAGAVDHRRGARVLPSRVIYPTRVRRPGPWRVGPRSEALGRQNPDCDAQFRYLNQQVRRHARRGEPVVSVDTKKEGAHRRLQEPRAHMATREVYGEVKTHDFVDADLGKAMPYGTSTSAAIGDGCRWASITTPAAFAVAALRSWWTNEGEGTYPKARRLLICADAGGSNSYRNRLWKLELARLAVDMGISITVCHFPPGTSKFNKIQHRLCSWSPPTGGVVEQ